MRAGTYTLSITPALEAGETVWMGGFEALRPAVEVQDELHARALVVEDGERRFGLVSLDLIGLFAEEVQTIRRMLREAGIRLDHLVVSCTHTHAGPDTLGVWSPDQDPGRARTLTRIRERVVQAVGEAAGRLEDVTLKVGETATPGLIRDTIAPEVIDETLMALQLVGRDGRPRATLVNWGNHAEVLGPGNQRLSADFPGVICDELERDGGMAMFLPRAIGGLMTPIGVELINPTTGASIPEFSVEKMETLGRAVATAARRALTDATPATSAGLKIVRREIRVPLTNTGLAMQLQSRISRTIEQDPVHGACLLTEVSHVSLGPLDLVMVPGEMYPELLIGGVLPADDAADEWRHAPLRSMVDGPMFLVGLANDELGYVIPPSQWHLGHDKDDERRPIYTPGREFAGCLFEALSDLLSRPKPAARPRHDVLPRVHVG